MSSPGVSEVEVVATFSEITGKKIKAISECFDFIILDELKKNNIKAWVAGGAIRSFIMNQLKSDVDMDVFFPLSDDYNNAVNLLKKCPVIRETEHSITYKYKGRPVDFVGNPVFETPLKTIQSFDFSVCSASISDGTLYVHDKFFNDLKKKYLRINHLKNDELVVMRRVQKYIRKGYIADDNTLQAIINFVNKSVVEIKSNSKKKKSLSGLVE